MKLRNLLMSCLMLLSFTIQAAPPAPSETVLSGIGLLLARNCYVNNDISVASLKNTEQVKFVLYLDNESHTGILKVIENGIVIEELPVFCKSN